MTKVSKVTTFLTDGFETVEALAVVDILRRANIKVDLVSINSNIDVMSAQQIAVKAEFTFDEYSLEDTDMIFLPGGPGTSNYNENKELLRNIKEFYESGRPVAAICAAPKILGQLGLLKGKKATCFPGCEDDLTGAEIIVAKVVTDGNIITARGMGASIEMGLELVKILAGKETSDKIARSTQFVL